MIQTHVHVGDINTWIVFKLRIFNFAFYILYFFFEVFNYVLSIVFDVFEMPVYSHKIVTIRSVEMRVF